MMLKRQFISLLTNLALTLSKNQYDMPCLVIFYLVLLYFCVYFAFHEFLTKQSQISKSLLSSLLPCNVMLRLQ